MEKTVTELLLIHLRQVDIAFDAWVFDADLTLFAVRHFLAVIADDIKHVRQCGQSDGGSTSPSINREYSDQISHLAHSEEIVDRDRKGIHIGSHLAAYVDLLEVGVDLPVSLEQGRGHEGTLYLVILQIVVEKMRCLDCIVVQHKYSAAIICDYGGNLESHEVEGEYYAEIGTMGKEIFSFIVEGLKVSLQEASQMNSPFGLPGGA